MSAEAMRDTIVDNERPRFDSYPPSFSVGDTTTDQLRKIHALCVAGRAHAYTTPHGFAVDYDVIAMHELERAGLVRMEPSLYAGCRPSPRLTADGLTALSLLGNALEEMLP